MKQKIKYGETKDKDRLRKGKLKEGEVRSLAVHSGRGFATFLEYLKKVFPSGINLL